MIGLVVTGHGHFADGIHTSAQMIAGENEYVRYINFEEGMTPEQLAEKFNAAFDEFRTCDGVVVLSDLPGGSPFKTAVECKYARPDQKIEVISGTNLPMIVSTLAGRGVGHYLHLCQVRSNGEQGRSFESGSNSLSGFHITADNYTVNR